MTRSMTQSAANDPEPSAFLKAMFFFKEAEKYMRQRLSPANWGRKKKPVTKREWGIRAEESPDPPSK